jgi:hypothetical protein
VRSENLYTDGRYIIFVNPVSKLLSRADIANGETVVLCYEQAWRDFFVVGDIVYFRELLSNTVCSVKKDGTDLKKYLKMPFTTGIIVDGVMYFINSEDYTNETVLYKYSIERGEWSAGALTGSRQSPMRNTVAFTDGGIYYISNSGGQAMNGCIGLYNYSEKAISGLAERVIEGSVSYLIRSAFYGSFNIESAVVINTHTGNYAQSNSDAVIIDENGWTVE